MLSVRSTLQMPVQRALWILNSQKTGEEEEEYVKEEALRFMGALFSNLVTKSVSTVRVLS